MTQTCLVLGANGRVGRLLRGIWASSVGSSPVLFQSRSEGTGVDIIAPFDLTLANMLPPVGLIFVLPGRTYGSPDDLRVNTDFALMGIELAVAIGCPKVALCSTAAVYRAEPEHEPYREEDVTTAARPYGAAKLAMEQAAARWHETAERPVEITCLRMANVVGADMLAQAVQRAQAGEPLALDQFPDGTSPRRSYLSPSTLAKVLVGLLKKPASGAFQIANLAEPGPPIPMASILTSLSAAGFDIPWTWQAAPETAIREVGLDTTRLLEVLPGIASQGFATTPDELVASWLRAKGGRP